MDKFNACGDAGCDHEFCTQCALYLCSTNTTTTTQGPPGSIACPLCRHGIVSFVKLPDTRPLPKEMQRTTNLSLTFCTCSSEVLEDSTDMTTPFCKQVSSRASKATSPSRPLRSLSCQKFSSFRINSSLCLGADVSPSLVPCSASRNLRNHLARCSGSGFRRSASHQERRKSSWFCSLNQSVATGSGYWFLFGLFIIHAFHCYKMYSTVSNVISMIPKYKSTAEDTLKLPCKYHPIVQLIQEFLFWQQLS